MSVHSATRLASGSTLTIVEAPCACGDPAHAVYRVEERNSLGTFVRFAYSDRSLDKAAVWVARAVERGYAIHPTIGS